MYNGKMIVSIICFQLLCIYKDTWTFPGNTSFRGPKRITCVIVWGVYIMCTTWAFRMALAGECNLSDAMGSIQIPVAVISCLGVKNCFSHFARYETYWVSSYFAAVLLLNIFHVDYELLGNIELYSNPEKMFWNYVIMIIALVICRWLWKRKLIHGIPQQFCNILLAVILMMMVWSPEELFDAYLYGISFSLLQIEILVVLCLVILGITGIIRLQKARMLKLQYYYECFYRFAEQTQKKLGVLRHEFANQREVLRHLPENSAEREHYRESLEKIYHEAQVPSVTGQETADRFFWVFRQLAEKTGHSVEICWEAGKTEITEKVMMRCIERLCILPRKEIVLWFGERRGKIFIKVKRKESKFY